MRRLILPGLLLFSLATLLACPLMGPHTLSLEAVRGTGNDARIFWELRLPRVLLAWITGATLSLCGMVFQALFRNPLASPDMLGVSTGAAFGAVLAIRAGVTFTLFGIIPGISVAAFLGAMAATAVIYAVGTFRRGGMSEASLLLGGVAVSFLFGSLNMILQYGGGYVDTFRMMRWSMGGIQAVGFVPVVAALPALAAILFAAAAFAPELDLFTCGENIAATRGVSVVRLRRLLFLAVSVSVGMNVALCGPIGFVGLLGPHTCRMLCGGGHRRLTWASTLFGGGFLVVCDTLARTVWSPAEIPVGILTSCVGSLFFLWLLVKGKRRT